LNSPRETYIHGDVDAHEAPTMLGALEERMRNIRLALAGVLMLSMGACGGAFDPQERPKQTAGAVLGGVGGAIAGAQFGGGRGQLATTAAGALLGAWLGSEIGSSLDKADREFAQQATYSALEYNRTGEPAAWRNPDSGRSGAVTPVRTYEASAGAVCREFETEVIIDGRREIAKGEACREADGRWRMI
jgi:surface antigen